MAALPPLAVSLIVAGISAGAQVGFSLLMAAGKKQQATDVGKFDDVRVTGAEYGAFIPRIWGTCRIGGNIIWSSGVEHTVTEFATSGGKGIPQAPAEYVHQYFTDFGLLLARSPITDFNRIWADADIIAGSVRDASQLFDAEDDDYVTLGGSAYVATDGTAIGGEYVDGLGGAGHGTLTLDCSGVQMPALPISRDPDEEIIATPFTRITVYHKNASAINHVKVTLTNIANISTVQYVDFAATNGEWSFTQIAYNPQDYKTVKIEQDASPNAVPDIDAIRVTKELEITKEEGGSHIGYYGEVTGFINPDIAYNNNEDTVREYYNYTPAVNATGESPTIIYDAAGLVLYRGTTNQPADQYLIDYLDTKYGVGNGVEFAPAFRDLSYLTFSRFNMKRGRLPNFTVEVRNSDNDVNQILTELAEDVGIASGEMDLTATAGLEVYGYLEANKASRKTHWENLARYFGFRFAEIDGKIKTIVDTFTSVATISTDSIRATNYGDAQPRYDCEIEIKSDYERPRQVRFSYMNPAIDFHNDTANAFIAEGVSSSDVMDYSFPIVAEAADARQRAEKLLLKHHSETKAVSFKGMPELMRYAVGDVVTVTLNNQEFLVRIEKKQAALPLGVIEFQGIVLDQYEAGDITSAIVATETAPTATWQTLTPYVPRNSLCIPFASEPIRESDRGKLGLYVAVTPRGTGNSASVALYQERGDENYVIRDIYDVPSVVGVGDGTLGSHANAAVVDTTNTLDIYFYNRVSLETVLQADIDRYPLLNLIRVGDEWLQFRTATAQTLPDGSIYRSVWRISNLTRGRFGTSGEMGSHGADEYAILATDTLKLFTLDPADVGETVTFKAVAGGQSIENAKATSLTFTPVSAYTITNASTDRAFDANCTTINELADVVATVIDDLNL